MFQTRMGMPVSNVWQMILHRTLIPAVVTYVCACRCSDETSFAWPSKSDGKMQHRTHCWLRLRDCSPQVGLIWVNLHSSCSIIPARSPAGALVRQAMYAGLPSPDEPFHDYVRPWPCSHDMILTTARPVCKRWRSQVDLCSEADLHA